MISNYSGFTALTIFQSSQLLGFAVKLLDLPTIATHLLYDLRVVLRHIVGHDIVCALGRKHNPEELHFMIARKAFDFDRFAMVFLSLIPFKAVRTPIVFEWTIVNRPQRATMVFGNR